jgi:DNA polymerase-3 subunit gamma/tau
VDVTEADAVRLRAQADRFDLDRLARVLDELGRVGSELRRAPDARLALEVSLARIARPSSDLTLESLAERVSALEAVITASAPVVRPAAPVAEAPKAAPAPKPAPEAVPAVAAVTPTPAPTAAAAPARAAAGPAPVTAAPEKAAEPAPEPKPARRKPAATQFDVAELRRRWKDILREVKAVRPAASRMFMNTMADIDGDTVVVEFAPEARVFKKMAEDADITAVLRESIAAVLGWHVSLRYQLGRGEVRLDAGDPSPYAPPSPSVAATDPDALDRALTEGLGAAVVGEPGNDDKTKEL